MKNRYKRFFADIDLDGKIVTAHVPNTGSMKSCWKADDKALITFHDNPNRKLPYTLEMAHNGRCWVGLNTGRANTIAWEGIRGGTVTELQGYQTIKREVKIKNSRIDLFLTDGPRPSCFVEVKSVTLLGEDGVALFPDAVTARGQKHLKELSALKEEGYRAVMLYIVQREDVRSFSPADTIDPTYGRLLREGKAQGLEVLAYRSRLSEKEISIKCPLPVVL